MNDTSLGRRQSWFRYFPEGNIEFLLVTRILAVFLLLALGVMRQTQRPMVLTALIGVLWVDYVLTVWWLVRMAMDLEVLFDRPDTPAEVSGRRSVRAGIVACLPSVAVLLLLTPWPGFLSNPAIRVAAAVAFFVLLVLAQMTLQRIGLGPAVWTLLLLIPVLHWFAVHRLIGRLRCRLESRRQAEGEPAAQEGPSLAIPIADATWVLTVAPWAVLVIMAFLGHSWPTALPPCATILAGLFCVADVAAVEGLQRQFAAAVRRLNNR